MFVISDPSTLSEVLDPGVRSLIGRRVEEFGGDAALATRVVVEPGDPVDAVNAQLGFSILS